MQIGILKLDGYLGIKRKMNINQTNNKFYYSINKNSQNNNIIIDEDCVIGIPEDTSDLDKLIKKIRRLMFKKDKNSFNAKQNNDNIIFDVKINI